MEKPLESKTQDQEFADMLGEAVEKGEMTPESEVRAHEFKGIGEEAEQSLRKELEEAKDEDIEEKLKRANLK